jgi:hypothetical protein
MIVTLINVAIGLAVGIYVVKKKDAFSLLCGLFLYISFHYAYSVIPIFIYRPHFFLLREEIQVGAKLTGLFFVLFILVELYRRYVIRQWGSCRSTVVAVPASLSIIWILCTFTYWGIGLMTGQKLSRVAIQDTVSTVLMLLLVFGFSIALNYRTTQYRTFWKFISRSYPVVLIVMFFVAAYQIAFSHTFAGVTLPNGEYVRRACAFLFNPNVLGLWASLTIFLFAYAYHSRNIQANIAIPLMLIAGLCVFLSGSRSGLLICVFFLITSSIFSLIAAGRPRNYLETFIPLITMSVATVFLFGVVKMVDRILSKAVPCIHSMSLLADRFLSIPSVVLQYLGMVVSKVSPEFGKFTLELIPMPESHKITNANEYLMATHPEAYNILLNIEQRFNPLSGIADNGFVAIFEAGNWLGIFPWCLLWIALVWLGFRSYFKKQDVNSAYALSAILGCVFSALSMRLFQVFPFWIMVVLFLGPALSWIFFVLGADFSGETSEIHHTGNLKKTG